jgi:hypothetical protein
MAGNIHEFQTPQLGITPSETGIDAIAQGARRVGAFYNQTGEDYSRLGQQVGSAVKSVGDVAVDYMDHQQISDGAAKAASFMANKNQQLEDAFKQFDMNAPDAQQRLPAVKQKFMDENLEPALQSFQQGFSTEKSQQWAEHFVDQYRNHMFEKAAAITSTMAGDAVKVAAIKTINGLSTAAFNDPSTVGFSRDMLAHSLDGMTSSSPSITADDAAKVKTELTFKGEEKIVKSAIMGAIAKGGNWQSIANDPKNAPYVDAVEMKQAEHAERTFQLMGRADARAAKAQADDDAKGKMNLAYDKLETETLPDKNGDKPNTIPDLKGRITEIMKNNPRGAELVPGRISALISKQESISAFLDRHGEVEQAVSNVAEMDAMRRIHSGEFKSEDQIWDMTKPSADQPYGKLNIGALDRLRKEYVDTKTPEGQVFARQQEKFLEGVKGIIDPSGLMGRADPTGAMRYYDFQQYVQDQINSSGKSKSELSRTLLNPQSPEYLGRDEVIKTPRFMGTLGGAISDNGGVGAPAAPAAPAAPKPAAALPRIITKPEYDKLPEGAQFIDGNGKSWTKPKADKL